VFHTDLETNNKFCLTEHQKIGFYNWCRECFQCGMHRVLI